MLQPMLVKDIFASSLFVFHTVFQLMLKFNFILVTGLC